MKKTSLLFVCCLFIGTSHLLSQTITLPPSSKKATVSENIGLTTVTINYSRPGVKGRDGKIWGELIPYNDGKPFPWRAGANENTVISFSDDVIVEGRPLSKGTYGLHVIPSLTQWIFIFSKNHTSWGSFSYNPAEDALRVTVPAKTVPSVEWLHYQFINQTDNSADVELAWERRAASFKVEVDLKNSVLANIRRELRNVPGFTWQGWDAAANFCLENNFNLDEALQWANRSISGGFGAKPTFTNHMTKSKILARLGRTTESQQAVEEGLNYADMNELYAYGRQMINEGRPTEALRIFEMNRQRYPNDKFITYAGLGHGYMANNNKSQALQYFRLAAQNAPANQKATYDNLVKSLE